MPQRIWPEVRRFVDGARAEFYLDGPMDVDWIFGNRVLTGREEALYVDLIEDEDGTHRWTGPAERAAIYDEPFTNPAPCSIAVSLVKDMQRIGLLTEEGLQFTRDAWDGVTVTAAMHWSELRPITITILKQLINAGRVLEKDNDAVGSVLEHWIFPLSSVDLRMQKVSLKKLQEEREHRLARELGGY